MLQIRYSKQAADGAKKLLLAWDPDFSKVTPDERKRIEQAEREMENGEYLSHEDVWSDIE